MFVWVYIGELNVMRIRFNRNNIFSDNWSISCSLLHNWIGFNRYFLPIWKKNIMIRFFLFCQPRNTIKPHYQPFQVKKICKWHLLRNYTLRIEKHSLTLINVIKTFCFQLLFIYYLWLIFLDSLQTSQIVC